MYCNGYFTPIEARAYIRAFKCLIATIEDIENYTLIVDASRQELCPEEVNPLIAEVINLYMDTPFKERRFVRLMNYDANIQVLCMADERFMNAFKVEGNGNNFEIIPLSVTEVARRVNLSLKETYSLIESNQIRAIKNRHIVVLKREVDRYLSKTNKYVV